MTDTAGLLQAMLAVQSEAPTLKKSKTNPHFKSKFAPLDEIVETINPILHKHGLVWSTSPSFSDVGPTLKYELEHAPTGEAKRGEMPLLLSKQDAQGQGSAITYARRYALCAVLNLVADEDDDGARAATAGSRDSSYGSDRISEASPAQKKKLRAEITKGKVDADLMDKLFASVGFKRGEGEKVNDAINRLSPSHASQLIDRLVKGALPTGASDVPQPGPDDFKHPTLTGEDDVTGLGHYSETM